MPYKNSEDRRAAQKARYDLISADPERKAKRAEQQRKADLKKPKRSPEKGAESYRRWYHERGGKELKRKTNGSVSLEEHLKREAEKKARHAEYMREWGKTEAGQRARTSRSVRKRCGLSIEGYDAAYDAQNGCCAICNDEAPRYGQGRLNADHCHKLGHFRALLCYRCNTGIGMFRENVEIMERAIAYIQERA